MAIGKIIKGSHFGAAVRYLIGEGNEPRENANLTATPDEWIAPGYEDGKRARILQTNLSGANQKEWAREFEAMGDLRDGKKIKDQMRHITFSLKPGESLTTGQWQEVAERMLARMGYKDSPYLAVQHRDRNHEHIHIITSRITYGGKLVSDSFEKDRLRTFAREIEKEHNLTQTPQRAEKKTKTKGENELVKRTNEPTLREQIQTHIEELTTLKRNASEFADELRQQGVFVKPNIQKSGKVVGISFAKADKDGKVWAFKGSDLGNSYKWSEVAKKIDYAPARDANVFVEAKREAERAERGEIQKPAVSPRLTEKSANSEVSERLLKNVQESLKRQALKISPEAWKDFEKDAGKTFASQRASEGQIKAVRQIQAQSYDPKQKSPETMSRLEAADYIMQHGSEQQRDQVAKATLERYEQQLRDESLRKLQMEKQTNDKHFTR